MTTITKSKSVSFSFLSRPTYPVLLLIFYLQQEIKLEWPKRKGTLPWYFKRWKAQGCSLEGITDSLPVIYSDAMYNAFHYKAVKYLMPLPEKYDAISWWYSQQAIMIRGEVIFPGQAVVHVSVVAYNPKHRKYPRAAEKQQVEHALRKDIIISEFPEEYRNNTRILHWLRIGKGEKDQYPPPICFPPLQPHQAIIPAIRLV